MRPFPAGSSIAPEVKKNYKMQSGSGEQHKVGFDEGGKRAGEGDQCGKSPPNPAPRDASPGGVREGGGEGGKAEQTERGGIKRIKVAAGGGGEEAGEQIISQISIKTAPSPAVLPGNQGSCSFYIPFGKGRAGSVEKTATKKNLKKKERNV